MKKIKLYRSVAIEFIEAIAKNLPDFQYSAADASSETADMPSSVSLINNINGSCLFKFSQIVNTKYTVLQTEYEKSDLMQIIIKQLPLELQQINILFLGTELYMPLISPTSRDALISELYYLIGMDNIDFPEYLIVLRQLLNNPHFDIVNFSTSLGPTPIVYAMMKKNYQIIDILLEYIVNVNTTSEGETPLCHAAYMGHNAVFQKLLAKIPSLFAKRVSLDIYDCKGRSILYIAAMYGHEQIVDSIIKTDRLHEGGVLYVACQQNHLNVVKILLDANYDVNERTLLEGEYRRTALHAAVLNNNLDIIKLLLSRSPNMDVPDDKGETALSIAYAHNYVDAISLLRKKGAQPCINTSRIMSQIDTFMQKHGHKF